MKKLSLDLDELRVETFETDARTVSRGTVMGQEFSSSNQWECGTACVGSDYPCDTQGWDCETNGQNTCGATMCDDSCRCESIEYACAPNTDYYCSGTPECT